MLPGPQPLDGIFVSIFSILRLGYNVSRLNLQLASSISGSKLMVWTQRSQKISSSGWARHPQKIRNQNFKIKKSAN